VDLVDEMPLDLDEVSRAEGLRHLTRVLHMGMFSAHDYADTEHPTVFLAKTPAMLSGGVTSDCIYHEAFVDGGRPYRLRGTRGSAALLEIAVYQGRLGLADRADVVDAILEESLVLEPDGHTFEITVSPQPKPAGCTGNWLWTDNPTRGRVSWVLFRQYDARIGAVEPARFAIEPVDGADPRPPLGLATIDDALTDSVVFARRLVAHFSKKATNSVEKLTNRFLAVDEESGAGEALPSGHRFAAAGFRLRPDEAWVVTIHGLGVPPYADAPYWGFQLCNVWFEPLDYGGSWAHTNNAMAVPEPDGSVRLVISEQRPSAGFDRNWVQLRGHTVGSAQFRLSRLDAPMPRIECEVVPIDEVRRIAG
jgi:hypothetical protein